MYVKPVQSYYSLQNKPLCGSLRLLVDLFPRTLTQLYPPLPTSLHYSHFCAMQSRVWRRSPSSHPLKAQPFRYPALIFLGLPTFLLLATVLEHSKAPEHALSSDNHLLATGLRPAQVRLDAFRRAPGAKPVAPAQAAPVVETAGAQLRRHLNFTDRTALNFMHFHKTGGVSYKTALFALFDHKRKRTGQPVRVLDACYVRRERAAPGAPSFHTWRCDWDPAWALPAAQRSQLDVVFGHQYWRGGAPAFLAARDLRTFAVVRHPLARKLSFFYHFFVRERGRKENEVGFGEVRDFLLFDRLHDAAIELGGDLGPNYMAGRLLSDGRTGFVGNEKYRHFRVRASEEEAVAAKAVGIMKKYVFVALQTERRASMCMLRKTVEAFNEAHGIDGKGVAEAADGDKVFNSGSYALSAGQVWAKFSKDDRALFNTKERVDLLIYAESVKMFRRQVNMFSCDHLLLPSAIRR